MTAPLKPCPFCGAALSVGSRVEAGPEFARHDASGCILTGQTWWFVPRFIDPWNTRADAPELVALVVAVRKIVNDAWGYGHIFDSEFHAHVHGALFDKLVEFEALK